MNQDTYWELRKGREVLGRLVSHGWTYPWARCDFEPTPQFDRYRRLFTGYFDLLEPGADSPEHWDEWETVYDKIVGEGLTFVPVSDAARQLRDDLLAGEGDKAGWLLPLLGG